MKATADLNSPSPTKHLKLIEVRVRRSDLGSLSEYVDFRNGLIGRSNNPWIKSVYKNRVADGGGIWAIVLGDNSNGELKVDQLLDFEEFYSESSHPLPSFGEVFSFEALLKNEWIKRHEG
jgi:hypothetical protein